MLSFWDKFFELHSKMLWHSDQIQNHLYASDPLDWPLMNKGIAYWVDKDSNVSIEFFCQLPIGFCNPSHIAGSNLFTRQHCHMVLRICCFGCILRSARNLFTTTTASMLRFERRRMDSISGSGRNIFLGLCHPLSAIFLRRTNAVLAQLLAGVHFSDYAFMFCD